jgi:predicted O-methyltransferase YrrM
MSRVDSLGLSEWWRFIKGDDLEAEWNQVIDHLFIDTSHTYDHTLKELQKFEPWVRTGGIITLHDIVAFPGVLRAVNDYLGERKDLQLYKYFHNNGLAVIFKGSRR